MKSEICTNCGQLGRCEPTTCLPFLKRERLRKKGTVEDVEAQRSRECPR